MKFNFKKIVSVFTSTVMLTSTLALAAAANAPAPFVNGGVANAAVVVGSSASADDMGAATVVKAYLDSQVTSTGSSASVAGGDFVQLDRSSTRLHIGSNTTATFGRSITVNDMPTLLADGVFTSNGDNKDQDYTQKITVAPLNLSQFDDSDYAADTPTLGVRVADGAEILNYTLQFTDKPAFDSIDNSDITIMGKQYTVSSHSGNTSITLLDSAQTQIINEGATQSVTIGGKSYDVTVSDVSSGSPTKVKVTVNGKTSSSLAIGSTYKITDGAYIGVKDASYKSKDTATSNAELTFGSGKLELTNGNDVQLNDNSVNNLVAWVTNSSSSTLSQLTLEWKADGDQFVTANSSITMPGFNNIKVSSTGVTFPSNEEVSIVNDGKYTVQLRAPIKDGDATIALLSNNASNGNYSIIGAASDKLLVTGTSSITFDANVDEEFVASWASTRDAESYLLYATSFVDDNGVNKTTIKSKVGNFERQVAKDDTINLGNVQLTVGNINRVAKTVALSGAVFNTLYTKDGLKIDLPTSVNSSAASTYNLGFTEANKDGNIAGGSVINVTLGKTSDGYVKVSNVAGAGGDGLKEIGSTSKYVGYVYSDLGTKIAYDQNPDQSTATLTYHGSEVYGNVIVSDVSTVVSGGSSGILIVKDNEASAMTGKNLVVVGGSCINTVAATLLGSNTPLCGTAWEAKTKAGAGSFVISSYAYGGKVATLVAGYNKADTENAAQYLKTNTVDTTAGKSYKGTSATTASLVVA
ncbi:MAG: hypothetical protein WCK29_01680 [archaeon]